MGMAIDEGEGDFDRIRGRHEDSQPDRTPPSQAVHRIRSTPKDRRWACYRLSNCPEMIPVLPTLESRQKSRHFGGIRMKRVRWRINPAKNPAISAGFDHSGMARMENSPKWRHESRHGVAIRRDVAGGKTSSGIAALVAGEVWIQGIPTESRRNCRHSIKNEP